jgi:6-phosphogluconolactonase (cycloisomerase 2 family)
MHLTTLLIQLSIHASAALAINLYVASSDGNLTTVSLTASSNGISLTSAFRTPDCGPNPSHLALDPVEHILYCLDRGSSKSTNGSINSFSMSANGTLTRIDRVNAPLSGVSADIFGSGDNRGFATAS